jgi:hypothetical protein
MMTTPSPHRPVAWPYLIAISFVCLKLWLVAAQPVVAIGPAGHDDRLYLDLANNILKGHWLGHYSQFTLAKGPMYSLWIAGACMLGLSLPLSLHLLYLAGCTLVVTALRPFLPGAKTACALFLLLWLNPMTYEMPVLGRVLRQNLYTPSALLFFAGLIALSSQLKAPFWHRAAWGCLLGISGAALWLTREESIWIAPSALLLVVWACIVSWRLGARLPPLLAPSIAALLCGGLIMTIVCTLNRIHYGWFGTVEFRAPQFIQAYGSLQRVESSYEISLVPVTREARLQTYAHSAAFAELRPYLEGEIGKNWAAASSPFTHHPAEDMEIAGGWFMWALRDATHAAGHTQNAKEALLFYSKIADQVNAACDNHALPAKPRRNSLVPSWRPENTLRLKEVLLEHLLYFISFKGFSAYPPDSVGTAPVLQLFSDLTRNNLAHSPEAPELDHPTQTKVNRWKLDLLQALGSTVRWVAVSLIFSAFIGWILIAMQSVRLRHFPGLFAVSTAALGAAIAVWMINLLVHVLSFPNCSPGAFAQAYPFLLLFAALAWIQLIAWMRPSHFSDSPAWK